MSVAGAAALQRPAAADEVQHEHHQRDYQQQMDQAAGDLEGEKAKRPQDEQDDGNRCEHWFYSTNRNHRWLRE